ncbi:MAG: cupin domain-containing protein [Desulfobacterales bacterium]|nr:cupin domain-containing protein [Desulfobacterales bacterium]
MERVRTRDREAIQNSTYEQGVKYYQAWVDRQKSGKLLIRFDDLEYQQSRQGFLKFYLSPVIHDTALNTWAVFEHLIKRQSGRHQHQGGIIIYVIEGEGATEVDGQILDWTAGDLLLLPIQPGGVTHQHWNKDPSKGCRWIAFRDLLISPYIANSIDQISETPDNAGDATTQSSGKHVTTGWKASVGGEQVSLITHPDQLATENMYDKLIQLRDIQLARQKQATWMIRGNELPWELNAHGKMQWYLHPCIAYSAVQTHVFYRQEIAVGSRSGLQRHGGDIIFKILEGEGYTEVDGVRYEWKKFDVMTLPLLRDGVVFRHVNTGAVPVLFLGMERNLVHTVGVARHAGFEEIQPCPEYRERQSR